MANQFFKQPHIIANLAKAKVEENINNLIFTKLNSLQVFLISLHKSAFILANNYFENSHKIATYHITLS